MGYLVGGLIPLIPYFFISRATKALMVSSILTGIILLIFGTVKARISGAARKTSEYVWGAVSTLLVGGMAACVAYGVVAALETN
jgi:vacuolar iron transporter family protein